MLMRGASRKSGKNAKREGSIRGPLSFLNSYFRKKRGV